MQHEIHSDFETYKFKMWRSICCALRWFKRVALNIYIQVSSLLIFDSIGMELDKLYTVAAASLPLLTMYTQTAINNTLFTRVSFSAPLYNWTDCTFILLYLHTYLQQQRFSFHFPLSIIYTAQFISVGVFFKKKGEGSIIFVLLCSASRRFIKQLDWYRPPSSSSHYDLLSV